MDNLKQRVLEISNKFPFTVFDARLDAKDPQHPASDVAVCENHLDSDFMARLENGDHIDPDIMPF